MPRRIFGSPSKHSLAVAARRNQHVTEHDRKGVCPRNRPIHIDELYVGVNRNGQQFVVPVQAKGGKDHLSVVQTGQDLCCCQQKFPELKCRPVSAQFLNGGVIAMFELAMQDGKIRVLDEKHYKLVPAAKISEVDLQTYARST